jgi:hypothetical protein
MLAERAERQGVKVMDADWPLFITPKGHPLHRDRFRQSIVRPALKAAGLPEKLRTYHIFEGAQQRLRDQLDALREATAGQSADADILPIAGHE